jgi:hypothetical protein
LNVMKSRPIRFPVARRLKSRDRPAFTLSVNLKASYSRRG